jgi:hypothetical protein
MRNTATTATVCWPFAFVNTDTKHLPHDVMLLPITSSIMDALKYPVLFDIGLRYIWRRSPIQVQVQVVSAVLLTMMGFNVHLVYNARSSVHE